MSTISKTQLNAALLRSHGEIIDFVEDINNVFDSQEERITTLENNSGTGFFYLDNDGDLCQQQ